MGARENKVELYLDERVRKLGGITRKWVSPNHVGVPDRIVILHGVVWFVEVKTEDGKLSTLQSREIRRLQDHGATVKVVYGKTDVDELVATLAKAVDA